MTTRSAVELRFGDGSPVRAASAVAALGGGWLVAQDDATYGAWWRPSGIEPVGLLPPVAGLETFEESAGTKHLKPDLEAAVALPGAGGSQVLLLGSGSSPARMRSALVRLGAEGPRTDAADLSPVYATVASALGIQIGDLNLEGACILGGALRWFQRGLSHEGAASACVDLDLSELLSWAGGETPAGRPNVTAVHDLDLGTMHGGGLAVTDALALADGRVLVSAAAEDTHDPRDDGHVVASAIALLADDRVLDLAELPLVGGRVPKVEGLALRSQSDRGARLLATVDADESATASLALELDVRW